MSTLWLFEDQLSASLVQQIRPDRVLLIESEAHFRRWKFHKVRIGFQLACMRHFQHELTRAGIAVHRYGFDRAPYLDSLSAVRHLKKTVGDRRFVVVAPSEHHTQAWLQALPDDLDIDLEIRPNSLFLTDRDGFSQWARSLKSPVMEAFYRKQRQKFSVLMEPDGGPAGGKWNLDKENRKPAKRGARFPVVPRFEPDEITRVALSDVERLFSSHPGSTRGFDLPTTRVHAEAAFDDFVKSRLPKFGDYEDAMLTAEPVLNHSMLSMLLNIGMLEPLNMIRRVEDAFRAGRAPLNSAEGFIRQILGWREYVYGIYWSFMPEYRARNTRGSKQNLPHWFWSGQIRLNCLSQCITGVVERAYSHHIQRLMIICNFATLAALDPQQVNDWFYEMYVDSHDWVVTPNVIGMGMNADGGTMATKPYVSSAAYIHRMSDYCAGCEFDHTARTGANACPFNFLFWTFLQHFRSTLKNNPRMTMMLKNAEKIAPAEMKQMMTQRKEFIEIHVRGGAVGS